MQNNHLDNKDFMGFENLVWFIGEVEDRDDPLRLGRCRVRCFGVHPTDQNLVRTSDLPWAVPMQPIHSAGVGGVGWTPVGPLPGTVVIGFFLDGRECQLPMIWGTVTGQYNHVVHAVDGAGQIVGGFDASGNPPAGGKLVGGFDHGGNPIGPNDTKAVNGGKSLPPVPSGFYQKIPTVGAQLMARYNLKDYHVAGIFGNLAIESRYMQPDASEKVRGRGVSIDQAVAAGGGYGWSQWTGSRLKNFQTWCKNNNIPTNLPATDQANYGFFCAEIDGSLNGSGYIPTSHYKNAISALQATTTVEAATTTWCNTYERPGIPHIDRRQTVAKSALNNIKGVNVPVRSVGSQKYDPEGDASNTVLTAINTQTTQDVSQANTVGVTHPNDLATRQTTEVPIPQVGHEPKPAHHAEYPYNKVYRSESGHVIEYDDTPDHERLMWHHRTGTYNEINEDGRAVTKVVNDKYTIVAGSDVIHIEGSAIIDVRGNITINCHNDTHITTAGNMYLQSNGDLRMKANNVYLESKNDLNILANNNINQQAINAFSIQATNDVELQGNVVLMQATTAVVANSADVLFVASSNVSVNASNFNTTSNTTVGGTLNAEDIELNSTSVSLPSVNTTPIANAIATGLSNSLTKDFVPAQALTNYGQVLAENDDDSDALQAAVDAAKLVQMITNNDVQTAQSATTSQTDSSAPNPSNGITVHKTTAVDKFNLDGMDPSDLKALHISKYWTLGQVTTNVRVNPGKHFIQPSSGLSVPELVTNLSLLAKNILEPLYLQYPNIQINSGFRENATAGSSISQHAKGQAVDISLLGNYSATDILNLAQWCRDNLPFDQIILEKDHNYWCHISFNVDQQRKQLLHTLTGMAPYRTGLAV